MRSATVVLILGVGICSGLGLLAPFYWIFDLFNHARPHVLVASVVAIAMAALFHRGIVWLGLLLALGNAGLFLWPALADLAQSPAPANRTDTPQPVTIMSANVLTSNRTHGALIGLIQRTDPDVVLLTEVDRRWIDALSPLMARYPHRILHPRSDNFGIAVLARQPMDGQILDLGSRGVPAAIARFRDFVLIGLHPLPPVSAGAHADNLAYLADAAARVATEQGPVVVAGDLNTTIWGRAMTPLRDAGLTNASPLGLAYTWPADLPVLAMQIDHILARDAVIQDHRSLQDIGSDHFPVLATITPAP